MLIFEQRIENIEIDANVQFFRYLIYIMIVQMYLFFVSYNTCFFKYCNSLFSAEFSWKVIIHVSVFILRSQDTKDFIHSFVDQFSCIQISEK